MNSKLFLGSLIVALTTAHGEFILIDDFEGLIEGALDGQNDWVADPDYTLADDPSGRSNKVLQYLFGAQAGAYKDLMDEALAEGDEGTLFYRFRFDAEGNANTGFSDVAAPGAYGDFESQVNRQANTPLKARDAGLFFDFTPAESDVFADDPDIWYNIWIVADNETDTSRVFIQSNEDPDFLVQTQVFPPDGTMNFRNGTSDPLATLMLRSQQGTAFWDDIFISAGEDLSNPAPVPVESGEVQIIDFEYIPGEAAELTWRSISGHQYAIETSPDLSDWTALANLIEAVSSTTTTELFDEDIAPVDGRLFFRVVDQATPGR